jgi:hypothetical protein
MCCFELARSSSWLLYVFLFVGIWIGFVMIKNPIDVGSLLLLGGALSPVLSTLTFSFASNTVNNLIALFFLLHLYSTDLRRSTTSSTHVSTTTTTTTTHPTPPTTTSSSSSSSSYLSPISANSAFAAIILMASRLESSLFAFIFGTLCAGLLVIGQTDDLSFIIVLGLIICSLFGVEILFGTTECLVLLTIYFFIGIIIPTLLDYNLKYWRKPLVGSWDILKVEEEEEKGVLVVVGNNNHET